MRTAEQGKQTHTPGPWTNGWGDGVTGPTAAPLVWLDGKDRYSIVTHGKRVVAVITDPTDPEQQANAALIAAAPEMHRILEQVFDSPTEPDKWLQNVRFALQSADGIERRPKSAEQGRDELRVQRAAPEMLEALKALTLTIRNVRDVYGAKQVEWLTQQRVFEKAEAAIAKAEGAR